MLPELMLLPALKAAHLVISIVPGIRESELDGELTGQLFAIERVNQWF